MYNNMRYDNRNSHSSKIDLIEPRAADIIQSESKKIYSKILENIIQALIDTYNLNKAIGISNVKNKII